MKLNCKLSLGNDVQFPWSLIKKGGFIITLCASYDKHWKSNYREAFNFN